MKQKEKMKREKYNLDLSFSSKLLDFKETEKETLKNSLELFSPLSSTGH